MKWRSLFSLLVLVAFFGYWSTVSTGCANIIPPAGGPRDSIPPVLLSATPRDSTVNFRGNRIALTFDEYVDLQDLTANALFTPPFETDPTLSVRLRTINIRFVDTLEPNTTYTLNFGSAIRDVNGGNILRDYSYTFSTGPALDSLTLSGNVVLAETGRVDTTLMVVLYRPGNDSDVVNRRPRYVTRLDGSGRFTFRNLPAGNFSIFALGGQGGGDNRRFNAGEAFAFSDSLVAPGRTDSIRLNAYVQTPGGANAAPVTRPSGTAADRRLRYALNLDNNQQNLTEDLVLTFEQPLRLFDSTRVRLGIDSVFTPVTNLRFMQDTARKEVTIRVPWEEGRRYGLILDQNFAEDTLGRRLLKTDTIPFSTRPVAEYGSLSLRVRGYDATRNPVLQFVQNEAVVYSAPLTGNTVTRPLFLPGEYELRLLYDANGNGKWDPGRFFGGRRQPETVRPIGRRITVKAAFENEMEVSL